MQEARMRQFGFSAFSRPAPAPTMPEGLVELMEGLGREVLRHNPADVHQFCADHMKKLLDIRDAHEGRTPAKPLTLEKKIVKAQEKVRQRAEQRRKKYDELIKQVLQEDRQVEEKEEMAIEKPAVALVDGVEVLNQVVNAFSSPTCDENVNTSNVANEKQEDETINQNIPAISEIKAEATTYSTEKTGEAEKFDNTDKEICMEDKEVDIKTIEIEAMEESAITEHAIENSVPTKLMSSDENDIIAQSNENDLVEVFDAKIVEEKKDQDFLKEVDDVKPVNEDTTSEHQGEGTIEVVVIEPQQIETESNVENLDENRDDKSENHMEIHHDNKDEQITVVQDENVKLIPEPRSTDYDNDSFSTMDEKEYLKGLDNVPTVLTGDSVETLPNLKCSENVSKKNDEVFDYKIAERETLDESLEEISDEKEFYEPGDETSEENTKKSQGNDDEGNVKPENLEIKNEPDIIDRVEIEIIELRKAPEVLDEKILKDNEVVIPKYSVNIDGDETNTVPVNISTDNEEEANDGDSQQHDVEESKSMNSQVSTDRLDIDIDYIAKSDSTNDMITEESNDSNSDYKHINGADDSLNKSPRGASTMDLETAAVTIQKVFRNFLFKSRASTLDDVSIDDGSMEAAYPPDDVLSDQGGNVLHVEEQYHAPNIKERRTLGITRMDTVLQTVNEEKSLSLSTDDSSLSSAATTIQAHVRGFLVRNKLHSHQTNSFVNSNEQPSFDIENEQQKNKTILNIHIVPEGGHYISRDESMAMSLDLPYDNSPTSSTNLHPFSYDTAERRKQLKRENAIQSISPPSNNSGKLSEDIDSVKDLSIHDTAGTPNTAVVADDDVKKDHDEVPETPKDVVLTSGDTTPTKSVTADTVIENLEEVKSETPKPDDSQRSVTEITSDEADVVTAGVASDGSPRGLRHSGEFHDAPLPVPTSVARADSTVAREFKNVLSYLLIWNSPSSS